MLMHSSIAFSQIDSLSASFEAYANNHYQEKIFAHTDKENYFTGEIIWFKLYVTDAILNQPGALSTVAYVELLNETNKPVMQAKIALQNSNGMGSFFLPYSIPTGNYILRCYTGIMQKSTTEYFFTKKMSIINALKKPEWNAQSSPVYQIDFFPEGGNLVNGIESKVGFKITDQFGKSIKASGFIKDELDQTVSKFETKRFGMGQFMFKPVASKKYHATLIVDGKQISAELPEVYKQGTIMRVSENTEDKLLVEVETTQPIRAIELLIHTRQIIKAIDQQNLQNGKIRFLVPRSLLGEGISVITVFDEQNNPLCERLYFKKPSNQLEILAKTDAGVYEKRQKINLVVNTANQNRPANANLSISAFLIDSLQVGPSSNILSYLWLESDLKGEVESPQYYFSDSMDVSVSTENLLLTQGWRKFKWESIGKKQFDQTAMIPELTGHIIWAKISHKQTGAPAPGVTVYLSIPGEKSLFYQNTSDQLGKVVFNPDNFYGNNQLILQTNSKIDSNYRIDLIDPFSIAYAGRKLPALDLKESIGALLQSHSMQAQIGNVFYTDLQQKFSYPELIDTLPFYGKPTHRYYLDDYTRFITMEEVLREYVEGVRLRKNNSGFNLKLSNDDYKNYFETEPTILLDGVPIFDVNQLISIDPLKIKRIDILSKQFFQNSMLMNGILSCNTYQADLGGYTLDPKALVIAYEGLQLKREFYHPIYMDEATIKSRLPDFRNVLSWMPEIAIDKNGKQSTSFFSSDITGKYLIVINGISKDGAAGFTTSSFVVK